MTPNEVSLCKRYLPRALAKLGPPTVSIGAGVLYDVYYVHAWTTGRDRYSVRAMVGDTLECIKWNGNDFDPPVFLKIEDIHREAIEVVHFYRTFEIRFEGLYDFVSGATSKYPYIKCRWDEFRLKARQRRFNRRKIATKKRMDLLRFMLKHTQAGRDRFSSIWLLTELHTTLWATHPDQKIEMQRMDFQLKALVDTQDLKRNSDGTYSLTGQGLRLIEDSEEQDRKFEQGQTLQQWVIALTVIIAALTFFQAGLIKMDPWYDGTKQDEKQPMVKPPPKAS